MASQLGDSMTAGSGIGQDLGGLAGNLALMLGAAGPGGKQSYQDAVGVWQALQDANFNFKALSPQQLTVVAEYMPELWQDYVPQDVKTVADSPDLRAAEQRGLQQLQQYASGQTPVEDRLQNFKVGNELEGARRQAEDTVISQLARRGQIGTGDELAARLGGAGDAATQAGMYGAGVAADAAKRRYDAVGQAGQLASNMRGEDQNLRAKNAAIINAFNESVANIRNQGAQARASAITGARAANARNAQDVANQNVQNANEAQKFNMVYPNELAQQTYENRLAKTRGLAGAYQGLGDAQYDEQAARSRQIKDLAKSAGSLFGGSAGAAFSGLF